MQNFQKNQHLSLSKRRTFMTPARTSLSVGLDKHTTSKGQEIMWRDRILEAKEAKGIKTKSMAAYSGMTEKTVTRMLKGETQEPYVGNVILLGASVGLTPMEIFSETGLVVGSQDLATLQAEVDRLTVELGELTVEVAKLKDEVASLNADNDILRLRLEHKEELIRHKDEIIALLRHA
jgi:AraC-like DNA-binding protein